MQLSNYLIRLLELCSDEAFGQEAVEWAVLNGHFQPTYNAEVDANTIMAPVPGGESLYDQYCAGYRQTCRQNKQALASVYESSGLLEEIMRPACRAVTSEQRTVTSAKAA